MPEHSIRITKRDSSVFIGIETDLGSNETLWFNHGCSSEIEAELLTRYLQKRHTDQIRAVRKTEFFSGWKCAKSKKYGKGFFKSFFGTLTNRATH